MNLNTIIQYNTKNRYTRNGSCNEYPTIYAWNNEYFIQNPEYTPTGIWESYENKGGNAQDTVNKKKYIIIPSVFGAFEYVVHHIQRKNGDWPSWHSRSD